MGLGRIESWWYGGVWWRCGGDSGLVAEVEKVVDMASAELQGGEERWVLVCCRS